MAWRDLISHDAKTTFDTLIERKQKLDNLKSRAVLTTLVGIFCLLLLAITFYKNAGSSSYMYILRGIMDHALHQFILVTFVGSFIYLYVLARLIDKAKKKYDTLRAETVDKFDTTWLKSINYDIRNEISTEMNQHGINIDYKG